MTSRRAISQSRTGRFGPASSFSFVAALSTCAAVWGCRDKSPSPAADVVSEARASRDGSWTFVTLKEESLRVSTLAVRVELIRADRPDGGHSYMLYEHARTALPAPPH